MKNEWERNKELFIILSLLAFMVAVLTTPIFIYLLH